MDEEHLKIRDTRISDQKVELGHRRTMDSVGPDAVLTKCTVRFRGNGVIIVRTTFERCVVKSTVRVKNLFMDEARFEDCRFEGAIRSWVFGNYGADRGNWTAAGISKCDFRTARVHQVRCHRCDPHDNDWPAWPHVVVFDILRHRDDWMAMVLPPALRVWQQSVALNAEKYDDGLLYVDDLSVDCEGDALNQVRELLRRKNYVLGP